MPIRAVGSSARQPVTRTLHVSVTQKDGTPVLDLGVGDFEIKENGRLRALAAMRLASTPLRVALLVSDHGSGQFQLSALALAEALLGHAEISIIGLIAQPERLLDYSGNAEALRNGLVRLARRTATRDSAAQLIETILDTTKEIRREGYRPAIVIMRTGGEDQTPIRSATVRDALRQSGAVMYAVSTVPDWLAPGDEGALTLATVLGDGCRESGGRHIVTISTTLVPTMRQIAAELLNQYEITYALDPGEKPSDRITVSTRRKGVALHAPTRVPN